MPDKLFWFQEHHLASCGVFWAPLSFDTNTWFRASVWKLCCAHIKHTIQRLFWGQLAWISGANENYWECNFFFFSSLSDGLTHRFSLFSHLEFSCALSEVQAVHLSVPQSSRRYFYYLVRWYFYTRRSLSYRGGHDWIIGFALQTHVASCL